MALTPVAVSQRQAAQQALTSSPTRAGMYLLIKPDGARYWRLKYRFAGKREICSRLGVFDEVSLAEAREPAAMTQKRTLRDGTRPRSGERKTRKLPRPSTRLANSFQAVAEEWMTKQRPKWTPGHAERVKRSIEDRPIPAHRYPACRRACSAGIARDTPQDRSPRRTRTARARPAARQHDLPLCGRHRPLRA